MQHLKLTALDFDGNVVEEYITKEKWCLSELDVRLNALKAALYEGEIAHIIIDGDRNGRDK
jgi:hypothetical protein